LLLCHTVVPLAADVISTRATVTRDDARGRRRTERITGDDIDVCARDATTRARDARGENKT